MDNAFPYQGQKLYLELNGHAPAGVSGTVEQQVTTMAKDHFQGEMDAFSHNVMDDTDPATPGEEGLADQKVLDAINASIDAGGKWVKVG